MNLVDLDNLDLGHGPKRPVCPPIVEIQVRIGSSGWAGGPYQTMMVGDQADVRVLRYAPACEAIRVDRTGTYAWTSSDTAIATVSSAGRVSAIAPGTDVRIEASAPNGQASFQLQVVPVF